MTETEAHLRCVISDLQRQCQESLQREAALRQAIDNLLRQARQVRPNKVASNPKGSTKVNDNWREIGSVPGKLKDVAALYRVSTASVFRYRQRVDAETIELRAKKARRDT